MTHLMRLHLTVATLSTAAVSVFGFVCFPKLFSLALTFSWRQVRVRVEVALAAASLVHLASYARTKISIRGKIENKKKL